MCVDFVYKCVGMDSWIFRHKLIEVLKSAPSGGFVIEIIRKESIRTENSNILIIKVFLLFSCKENACVFNLT